MVLMSVAMLHLAFTAPLTLAPDQMSEIDGKRTFILGLYENPKDDAALKAVADAGFNLVSSSEDDKSLDRLHALGLHAWINTGANVDFSESRAGREAKLANSVTRFAKHPALIVWEVPDEALWNCWYGPDQWRFSKEPKDQRTAIAALTDATLKEKLTALRVEADELTKAADYAKSEQIADDIWKQLGKTQPQPGVNFSTAAQAAAKMQAGMLEGYQKLKALDPAHPVWMNYAPRNLPGQLAAFAKAADIVGCDIYPVPVGRTEHSDLTDVSIACVGAYTDRFERAAPGKPVWMVLQGFGWGDIQPESSEADRKARRRPTYAETRFMAFDTVVHGARGILYWGTAYIEKDSECWRDLLKVIRELADLQPVLSAPDAKLNVTATFDETSGSVDRAIEVLPKNVDGKTWLLVVNEWHNNGLRYTLQGLNALEGKRYVDTTTKAEATVTNGQLAMNIPGNGVHVLRPLDVAK